MKNLRSLLSHDLNKELTRQCKEIGITRSKALGYIIDNQDIVDSICEDIFEDHKALVEIHKLELNKTQVSIPVNVSTNNELSKMLSTHKISVSGFLYYIITRDVIKNMKDEFPEELVMKKLK